MLNRRIGSLEVFPIGLGCYPMTPEVGYNPEGTSPQESRATLHRAVELGVTLFDTADVYGPFTNEKIVGEFLVGEGFRDRIKIATKVGYILKDEHSYLKNGKPEYIRKAIDDSLMRLRTDYVDLYQLHRVDPEVPIEETWAAMAEQVTAGKVLNLGLSEVTVDEIMRAETVHPVASVQSELSVWTTDHIDNGVVGYCNDNNIGFLAFSPLGRGFLTGTVKAEDIKATDFRAGNPRFTPEAIAANQAIVDGLSTVAARHNITTAQLSLAWIMAQGPNVIPIPGTKRRRWLEQNMEAVNVQLTSQDLADIAALPKSVAPRY